MTKKQIVETLDKVLVVGQPLTKEKKEEILALFAAKSRGGGKRNIEDIIKVENGKVVAILDTVANVWLPADEEHFYKDLKNPDPKLNGLKNHSKAREKLTKEHQKLKNALKKLMWDGVVTSNKLSKDELNALAAKLPKIDYSRIVPFGQPNAGEIKPSKEVAEFEQLLAKLEAKVHPPKAEADDKPKATPEAKPAN
jgi:hypothetical protein